MHTFHPQLLAENPLWERVLRKYLQLARETSPREEEQAGPRWSARIESLEEIPVEELGNIHGQLIAQGWLTFQLEDGRQGLSYRISAEGRQALERIGAADSGDDVFLDEAA